MRARSKKCDKKSRPVFLAKPYNPVEVVCIKVDNLMRHIEAGVRIDRGSSGCLVPFVAGMLIDHGSSGCLPRVHILILTVPAGRASPGLLEPIEVQAHNERLPLYNFATVTVRNPHLLVANVYNAECAVMGLGAGRNEGKKGVT
eukprot:58087-Pelagomonas_calceolata.AAC.2